MEKHSIENEYAVFWLDKNDIIHSDYKDIIAITYESAKAELEACKKFDLNKKDDAIEWLMSFRKQIC